MLCSWHHLLLRPKKKTLKFFFLDSVVSGFSCLHSRRWIDFLQWIIKSNTLLALDGFVFINNGRSMWSLFSDFSLLFSVCAIIFIRKLCKLYEIYISHIHFCFRTICELIIVDSIILSPRGMEKDEIEQMNAEKEKGKRRKECKKAKSGKFSVPIR